VVPPALPFHALRSQGGHNGGFQGPCCSEGTRGRGKVKRVKRVTMVNVLLYIYEYGTLKPVHIILTMRRENNRRNAINQGALYTYMEISQ
jgi:hypothetical protein